MGTAINSEVIRAIVKTISITIDKRSGSGKKGIFGEICGICRGVGISILKEEWCIPIQKLIRKIRSKVRRLPLAKSPAICPSLFFKVNHLRVVLYV